MKINKLLITTLLCLGVVSMADARRKPPPPATHHTITPSVNLGIPPNSPGVWTYTADLSSGQAMNGDGFTIFDFGGYVAGSIFAPAGWSAVAQLTGSVLGVAPPASNPDDPSLFNLLFTRIGGTLGPTSGIINLGNFGATTTFTSTTFVGWSSRDHFPTGNPPAPGTDHADIILAPAPSAVPDGGATVALLGIALGGLEGMRRLIRARKV
jgi:hypothetical protein